MTTTTALVWTRTKVDASYGIPGGTRTVQHTAYVTSIGDLDVRIEKVDDLFFIKVRRIPTSDGMCRTCGTYGFLSCRETVGKCDLCGHRADVYMDYSKSGDRENPDETVCLDCMTAGAHIKAAHSADPFNHPGGNPVYAHTLREAKADVQRIADRVAARATTTREG